MKWQSYFKRNLISSLLLVLIATFGASVALGQTGTTSLHGVVTDKTGAAVAHVKLTLIEPQQNVKREATSNSSGDYEFLSLPPGTYTLTAEMSGFQRYQQPNIQLLVNNPATANVSLTVGTATQTVEVSAQAETLNTTDASLGIAFNENQVKQLPLEGRNVPDLLTLQPGVVFTGDRTDINSNTFDTRSGAVDGARSDQSNITLDGIPVNPKGGAAFQSVMPVTLDSVQEFRVTTTNYNADQGVSSGAQAAMVTKSGTNDFHGSVYEYMRNTYTSANDYFVKQAQLQSGQPNIPPELIRNIFGGSLGGAIWKNRLFFFTNYEGTRRAEAASETQVVPSATLRDGVVLYPCSDPSAPGCAGGTVAGLSGKSYPVPAGFFGLTPGDITKLDPLKLGPNPVMVNYLQKQWPMPNQFNVGDGYNYQGFTWAAPIHDDENVYIAKIDYNITADAKQRLSVSAALRNESNPGAAFLPGQAPSHSFVYYNKGIIANYNSVITSSLINNFRYGFIRESIGDIGNTNQPTITFRGLNDQSGAITYTSAFQRPVHNFYDDVSWIKGKHTWQFGTAISLLRNPTSNYLSSFSTASTNASWLNTSGFAQAASSPFNPSQGGFPAIDTSFANAYDYPLIALLGMVTEDNAQYNYLRNGTAQAQGSAIARNYAQDSFEFYGQDTWKVKSNLTLTLGLRYSLFSPPWETNGLQVAPTESLTNFFNQRGQNMQQGIGSYADTPIAFDWAGPANGKPGYYNWDTHDFGPRVAFAWAPSPSGGLLGELLGQGKTSIRGGFGIVYDRVGESLVDTFDSSGGAFGLSTNLSNPAGFETASTAPRLTGLNTIPTTDLAGNAIFQPAPPATYPATYPNIQAIAWGLDSGIRTPYSYDIDFSVERELRGGFLLQVAYVGRLSHHLLTQEDVAMPLDIHDKGSGLDYFAAVQPLAKLYRSGNVTDATFNNSMVSPAVVKYWQDVLPAPASGSAYSLGMTGGCGSGGPATTTNPVLAAFDLFCGGAFNETTPLLLWDDLGIPDANGGSPYFPLGHSGSFFNQQFSSLYAWRSIGDANYNGMQVTLSHAFSHGVQFDFNYTYSKSIDISSDAERISAFGGLGGNIINSWDPNALRAISDFNATHQLNSDFVADLPFGRGKMFARNSNRLLDALIGGWQLSGIFRLTSGFPVNVSNGARWPTNWQLGGQAFLTGPVTTGNYTVTDPTASDLGAVNMFSNQHTAINSFTSPLPGQSGARNQIIGNGYFGLDAGLSKRWTMPWSEKQSLQFRWEVFNVTNSVRFNVQTGSLFLDTQSTFGDYTGLLTNPRVMQFALRYEF